VTVFETPVEIESDGVVMQGDIAIPPGAGAVVVFAHGSGSSRNSPRNRQVARRLQDDNMSTLLLDLLTSDEEAGELSGGRTRFDIELLSARLLAATAWLKEQDDLALLPIGYFGASTGAAAALVAAAKLGDRIGAVVSRGGRPDLAADVLPEVQAPTLLIIGSRDTDVVEMNRRASEVLRAEHQLEIVEGASHLFEEPGALEQVSDLASAWFADHLLKA
jgi:putative phosphoribosyl transferase